MREAICQMCGKTFTTASIRAKFCPECRLKRNKEYQAAYGKKRDWHVKVAEKTCIECGQVFRPSKNDSRIVRCKECQKKAIRQKSKERAHEHYMLAHQHIEVPEKTCIDCGKTFQPPRKDKRIVRCPVCQEKKNLADKHERQAKIIAQKKEAPPLTSRERLAKHMAEAKAAGMSYAVYMTKKKELGWI